jgi:O-antigen/teichoic acid export membrane protein
MSYMKRALRGTFWVMLFHVGASVISYGTRVVLARNLTPSEYGLFYAVFTFVMFFMFFRDLGLVQSVAKYIPEYKIQEKYNEIKTVITSALGMQLISSVFFSITFYVLADYLAVHYFKGPDAAIYLKYLIIYVIASVIYRTMKSVFHGFQSMFFYASGEFMKNVVVLSLIILFLKLGYGTLTPLLAFTLVFPILIIIYAVPAHKTFNLFKHKITDLKPISKKVLFFGIPVFATAVGSKVIGYIDTLILTYFRTTAEVGIYNVILPTALILLFAGTAISSTLFPMSSELWAKNDKKRLAQGVRLVYRYTFVAIAPIIMVGVLFSKFFITVFFGVEYASGSFALQILLIGMFFFTIAVVNKNLIAAIGKPTTVTKIILGAALLNIILNIILIPTYGINGAAIATTLSYILVFMLSTYKGTSFIETTPPLKEWFLLAIPISLFFIIVYFGRILLSLGPWIEVFLLTGIAGMAYLTVSFMLGIIEMEEIKRCIKSIK